MGSDFFGVKKTAVSIGKDTQNKKHADIREGLSVNLSWIVSGRRTTFCRFNRFFPLKTGFQFFVYFFRKKEG
jgi:hypothetical protein